MAVGVINRLPEGTGADMYDAVQEKLGLEGNPPDGQIFHSAGQLEGRFQIFDVWESERAFQRFREGRLREAMVAAFGEDQVSEMPDAEVVIVEVYNYAVP